MRVLVDTNVLLRQFDRASAECGAIRSAFLRLNRDGHQLATTAQNVAEFWNVSTRPITARGGLGQSISYVHARVNYLERNFDVLPFREAAYAHWRRIIVDYSVTGVSVHDARLVATMLAEGLSHIVTFNLSDFSRFRSIVALTPDAVVAGVGP